MTSARQVSVVERSGTGWEQRERARPSRNSAATRSIRCSTQCRATRTLSGFAVKTSRGTSVNAMDQRRRFARCSQLRYEHRVTKRLQAIGNSAGIIIDKPVLELLKITAETELEIETDGTRLIITPVRASAARQRKLAAVQAKVIKKHEGTFRKLAK